MRYNMLSIVNVLEQLGATANLTSENMEEIVASNVYLSKQEKFIILSKDNNALLALELKVPEITCFGIIPAEPDEVPEEDDNTEATENNLSNVVNL